MGITVLHRDLHRGQRYSPLSKSKRSTCMRCWELSCTASKYLQNPKTQVHSKLHVYFCSNPSDKIWNFFLNKHLHNLHAKIHKLQNSMPILLEANWRTHQGRNKFKIVLLNYINKTVSCLNSMEINNIDTMSLCFQWPSKVVNAIIGKLCILIWCQKGKPDIKYFPRKIFLHFYLFQTYN